MKKAIETLCRGIMFLRQRASMRRVLWLILSIHSILLCSTLLIMLGNRAYFGRIFEIGHQNECKLNADNAAILLERELRDVEEMLYSYSARYELEQLVRRLDSSSIFDDVLEIREIIENINLLRASKSTLQELYVLLEPWDRTISSAGTTPTSWLLSNKLKMADGSCFDLEQFKDVRTLQVVNGVIEGKGDVLFFVYPRSKVVMIAAVRKTALIGILDAAMADNQDGIYCLYSVESNVPYLTNAELADFRVPSAQTDMLEYGGERYLHQRSERMDLATDMYISILLPETNWADESSNINLVFFVLSILFVLVDFAVFAFTYGNWYQPIRRIVGMLGAKPHDSGEYDAIESAIHAMQKDIEHSSQIIHEHYIYKAVHGLADGSEWMEHVLPPAEDVLKWNKPYTIVLCVCEDGEGKNAPQGLELLEDALGEKFKLLKLMVEDREVAYYVTPHRKQTVFDWKDDLKTACKKMADAGYYCMIGAGPWQTDAKFLQSTYAQSREALREQLVTLDSADTLFVGFYDERKQASLFRIDEAFCRNLLDCLTAERPEEMQRLLDKALPDRGIVPYGAIRENGGSILLLICMVLAARSSQDNRGLLERCDQVKKIWHPLLMTREIHELVHETVEVNRLSSTGIGDMLKLYVSENYNQQLSLNRLSEAFMLSPGYISQLFKKGTGMNFAEYLQKCRIVKAQSLLMETEHTIQEIALMVGYEDVGTFIRAFKRLNGTTPGKYKQQTCQENSDFGKERV